MTAPELMTRYQVIRDACDYRLTGQPTMRMADQIAAIAEQAEHYDAQDVYGTGVLIESFEADIAELLGKEAVVFLPSGTMAQCIALRVWADRKGNRRVGFHSSSHLQLHEQNAYQELYGLEAELLGEPGRVVTTADLQTVSAPLSAALLELPMREIGGQLPNWEDLQAQSEWARQHGTALHMDGARLWQCTPYYGRSMADIADLFDSVYLSFYKDIGGIAGSALAGPADFIEEARNWIRRAGGNLYSLFPYVLAAKAGMQRNLASLPQAVADAQWLAGVLNQMDGLETVPLEPPANLFHLRVDCEPERLLEHACSWSKKNGVFLMPAPRASEDGKAIMEYSIGQALPLASRAQWQLWLENFFATLKHSNIQ